MLPVNPCPLQISKAFTSMMLKARRSRWTARWRLRRAESVAGLLSISNRTSVICFTTLAPHHSFVEVRPFSQIGQSVNRLSFPMKGLIRRTSALRGCSPQNTLFRSVDYRSRKTLGRSELAVELKLPMHSVVKALACGKASCSTCLHP